MIELGSDGWRDCGGTTATGMLLPRHVSDGLEERLGKSQKGEEGRRGGGGNINHESRSFGREGPADRNRWQFAAMSPAPNEPGHCNPPGPS